MSIIYRLKQDSQKAENFAQNKQFGSDFLLYKLFFVSQNCQNMAIMSDL
ncbi:hypothetical protein NIES80_33900 [Dolichospermum planctonicum]|uniref:Uncharacterized protein n=1 Tax=Dolichospermum planctonicum TaxID=136072 RepID=A0A480AH45_9CYAN|nr:hypothetical protein NIES80_33900 [Dolichospermum planctonicum]